MQDLVDRSHSKKDRRAANKLLNDTQASARGTPMSDTDSRGRKMKKGKSKMGAPEYEPSPSSGKRKRGIKSMSVTPSINDEDEDDRDSVSFTFICVYYSGLKGDCRNGERRRVQNFLLRYVIR